MKSAKLVFALLIIMAAVSAAIFASLRQNRAGIPLSASATTGSNRNPLCNAPGVLKCIGFDTAADIAGKDGISGILAGDATAPQIDSTVKASGEGSLKFTIPARASQGSSGAYFTDFSNDLSAQFGANSEFYVQWRQRFSPEFLANAYAGGNGWKQVVIGTGDQPGKPYYSCTALEVVAQNTYLRGFAQMYNSCSGSSSHAAFGELTQRMDNDWKLQNARPAPYCLYSQGHTNPLSFFPPAGNCLGYFPNEWMTFQIHIKTGPRANDEFTSSYVQLWVGREGRSLEPALDFGPYNLSAGDPKTNQRFGKVWLLPYNTNKDASISYPVAYTWYDDLIISTKPIGDATAAAADAHGSPGH